jgi:predicted nucleic acid-binding protein
VASSKVVLLSLKPSSRNDERSESVKKPNLLDSFALLAFLNKEKGFGKVRELMHSAEASGTPLLMNEMNIGEVYYIAAKERSQEAAEEFLHRLEALPIQHVPNSFAHVLEAARIKARFPLSYADAFVVSTAMRLNAIVVTGDPEFHAVAHLIEILWI